MNGENLTEEKLDTKKKTGVYREDSDYCHHMFGQVALSDLGYRFTGISFK